MITITEALAEIKTIEKRIASKRTFISQYLIRMDNVKDPLEKDGGSDKQISQEMQAIKDLEDRRVELRRGIATANDATTITVEGDTRSIADWLIWRREVAPGKKAFLRQLQSGLNSAREQVRRQNPMTLGKDGQTEQRDLIVNMNEKELSAAIEKMENILGQLDGMLSLKNATVTIQLTMN